ncbi:MAG: DUF983 domain-containing protein [Rhodobacteraceae bacterium]|jgi:uncharacterized protein (DUF983 family)|nr:DUF983 domain-containing protein [Paracoccaceae bacterium]
MQASGSDLPAARPLGRAMLAGLAGRCPACARGRMLAGYLRVAERCPACGEALHHHRADDGPAYLTVLLTGKLAAIALYAAFVTWRPDPAVMAAGFAIGSAALALLLLPRLKGLVVAIQWAQRMHGFGRAG